MDKALESRLDRFAMNRHGLVTRRQALELGMTPEQLRRHLGQGQLVRLRPGVYRVRGAPSTWVQTVLAACLATGGTASHQTACRLYGSAVVTSDHLVLTVVRGHCSGCPAGVELRRTARYAESDRTERLHVPVTSPLRTLSDMASELGEDRLLELTSDFLGRRLIAADQLRRHLEEGGLGTRRPGARRLREVALRVLEDGPYDSAAETRLHRLLIEAAMPAPVRQLVVRGEDGKMIGRLDFAWPDRGVNLELDGYGFHSSPAAFRANRLRDLRLTALGWTVVRTTPADLAAGPTELLTTLRQLLAVSRRGAVP